MKVYTHINVDLDAAMSTALAKLCWDIPDSNIHFIPIDSAKDLELDRDDLILDISHKYGIKGDIKYINGRVYQMSAFSSLLNTLSDKWQKTFYKLSKYIDGIDGFADGSKLLDIDLAGIPTINDFFKALKKDFSDIELVNLCFKYLRHKIKQLEVNIKKESIYFPSKNIAVADKYISSDTMSALFNKDIDIVIYHYDNNMGAVRSKNKEWIDLGSYLKSYLPDWFHHPSGFLSAWGTLKNPKEQKPNITLQEFIPLVEETYEKCKSDIL